MTHNITRMIAQFTAAFFLILIATCKTKPEPPVVGIQIPGLKNTYHKLEKLCDKKGKKDLSYSGKGHIRSIDSTDRDSVKMVISYDSLAEKISITVFKDTSVTENLTLYKNQNSVQPSNAWRDKMYGDSIQQESLSKVEIERLLSKL